MHNYDLINNTYESNGYITYSYHRQLPCRPGLRGQVAERHCNSTSAVTAATATTRAVGTLPCYSSFVQGFGPPVFAISTLDYGVFAQDNWKVCPRLTLELGVALRL